MWIDKTAVDMAPNYRSEAIERIASTLGVPQPKSFDEVRVPPGTGYVLKRSFDVVSLHPQQPIDGVLCNVEIYGITNGDVQVLFVLEIPRDIDRTDRVIDPFHLSLETLEVDSRPARAAGAPGSSSSGSGPRPGPRPGF